MITLRLRCVIHVQVLTQTPVELIASGAVWHFHSIA